MRFFIAALVLTATCVLAGPGDPIGNIFSDNACGGEVVAPLIDNECTSLTDLGSVEITASNVVCYLFPEENCAGESTYNDQLTAGCQVAEQWTDGKVSANCFGQ